MFILIFVLHLLIQPAYAQTATGSALPSIVVPSIVNIAPTDTPVPPTSSPTVVISPTGNVTPTTNTTPTVAPTSSITPTSGPTSTTGVTPAATPWPTWTPIPVAKIDTPTPTPLPVATVVKNILAPDTNFSSKFLQFEKDGNYYASSQLSPSETRWVMLLAFLLIASGITSLSWDYFTASPKMAALEASKFAL